MLKKLLISIILLISTFYSFAISDTEEIKNTINIYQTALNEKDYEKLKTIIKNRENLEAVLSIINNPYITQYSYFYDISIESINIKDTIADVKTKTKCTVDFSNLKDLNIEPITTELSHTFVLIKENDKWLLIY